ncbi:MAG: hypothetical protein H0Z40_06550 [Desulfotomaculum sp.]|nr:hypothetical protein [Desulfotomaculum sp.]
MKLISKELENLLATDVFQTIINSDTVTIAQINAVVSVLIKAGIDFDLSFSRGTNSLAKQAQLTVAINPTTSISFTFAFEPGAGVFD